MFFLFFWLDNLNRKKLRVVIKSFVLVGRAAQSITQFLLNYDIDEK